MTNHLVDRDQPMFVKAADGVLLAENLSAGAKVAFFILKRHALNAEQAYPSRERLARLCGVSVPTIGRQLAELRKVGLIERVQQGHGKAATTYLNSPDTASLSVREWAGAKITSDPPAPAARSDLIGLAGSDLIQPKEKERKKKESTCAGSSPVSDDPPPKKAKRKRKAKATPPASEEVSDHTRFIRWLCDDYLPSQGVDYIFQGGKDAKVVAKLLKAHKIGRLKRLVRESMKDEWLQEVGWSLSVFMTKVNQIAARLPKKSKKKKRRKKRHDFTELCGKHAPDEECDVCVAKWEAYREGLDR